MSDTLGQNLNKLENFRQIETLGHMVLFLTMNFKFDQDHAPRPGCRILSRVQMHSARAALESSSKRGSFDRISNHQEFWSVELGHLTYNNGNRAFEVLRGRKYF